MDKILSLQTLWQDADFTSGLDVNILRTDVVGDVTRTTLYYTGSTTDDGQARIFAVMYTPTDKKATNGVLYIQPYDKPIDESVLAELSDQGYVAMSIDFTASANGPSTLYPDSLNYCNVNVNTDIFLLENTAKQTKLFQYAYNVRRAITVLSQYANKVSLMAYGNGTHVGAIALSDKRFVNGVLLFGNLLMNYPTQSYALDNNEQLTQQLANNELEQAWTMGLAPQTYLAQTEIPLYIVNSTNSSCYDVENISDVYRRLVNDKSKLLLLPTVKEYLPTVYAQGVLKWIKSCTCKTEPISINLDQDGKMLQVESTLPLSKLELWYAVSNASGIKYFSKANLVKGDGNYVAELNVYTKQATVYAFCNVKGAVNYSTPINTFAVNTEVPLTPNNFVFDGRSKNRYVPLTTDNWFNVDVEPKLSKGKLDIVGADAQSMLLMSVTDDSVKKSADELVISFDVCGKQDTVVTVTVLCNYGIDERFSQQVSVTGNGTWQRVTVEQENFRSELDGKHIADDKKVYAIEIYGDKQILINNVSLV